MIKRYSKLIIRFIIISWKNIYIFKFELLMVLVNLIFNISFIFIFWYSLLSHISSLGSWNFSELAIYSAITLIGESLGGIFFGFRDLPSKIVRGDLDKYLSRPINTLFAVLFEQVSIVYFIEQLCVSIILLIIIIINYDISIKLTNTLMCFIVLTIGVLVFNFIYGVITFLAFWFGRLEIFRGLILGLTESKQYPISIFPRQLQLILTYIIPIAFTSYYPTVIILDKINIDIIFFMKLMLFLIVVFTLFITVWCLGIKRYESNGG